MPFDFSKGPLPRDVGFFVALWCGISYLALGPTVGARIAKVDHLKACNAEITRNIDHIREEQLADANARGGSAAEDLAADQIGQVFRSPALKAFGDLLGTSGVMEEAIREAEARRKRLREAKQKTIDEINERTKTQLAKSHSICGCVADSVIQDNRMEWAAYAGTLGLYKPTAVEIFGDEIHRAASQGVCLIPKEKEA